jgi:hypothetical protein
MAALDRELDDPWRADRDYILADMNGSAVILPAVLKMRLTLAVRRRGGGGRRPAAVFARLRSATQDLVIRTSRTRH